MEKRCEIALVIFELSIHEFIALFSVKGVDKLKENKTGWLYYERWRHSNAFICPFRLGSVLFSKEYILPRGGGGYSL